MSLLQLVASDKQDELMEDKRRVATISPADMGTRGRSRADEGGRKDGSVGVGTQQALSRARLSQWETGNGNGFTAVLSKYDLMCQLYMPM
jgi:hypothetical protein